MDKEKVSLQSVLEYIPAGTYEWLSGRENATEILISWIACGDKEAQPDDLVLLPSSDITMDLASAAFISQSAAVGIVGEEEIDLRLLQDKPAIRFRNASDIPSVSLRLIHQLLLRSLLSRRSMVLEQSASIQTRLTQIAARGEGLTSLAAAMREMTQHGILVQDKRLSPLVSSPTASLRDVWDDLLAQLSDFSTLPEILRDRRRAGEEPTTIFTALPGGLGRVIAPIVVGEVARGYLSAIGLEDEMDRTDRLVTEQGALVCAIEMARAKAVRETEKRLHGDLLSALLHQNLSARDAHLWAQNMGLDLGQQHTAIRMAWEGPSPTLRRLETLVNGEVARSGSPAIVSSLSGEVIIFCQSPREAGRPDAAIALALSTVELAAKEYPEAVIRCGIGTPAPELGAWQLSFRQAGQALDMARRLDQRKPLYYMDLSVYRLLLQFEDHPYLQSFLQETLGSILINENADELLATLEEFFAHNGNLSQTAEALFIHRNTLTYRMERMKAAFHLDLENPDMRLAVQLALRIRRMLKAA